MVIHLRDDDYFPFCANPLDRRFFFSLRRLDCLGDSTTVIYFPVAHERRTEKIHAMIVE